MLCHDNSHTHKANFEEYMLQFACISEDLYRHIWIHTLDHRNMLKPHIQSLKTKKKRIKTKGIENETKIVHNQFGFRPRRNRNFIF